MKLLWFLVLCCLEVLASAALVPLPSTCQVLAPLCQNGCTIPQLDAPYICMDKSSCVSTWESAKSIFKNLPNPVKYCLTTPYNSTECKEIDASRESIDRTVFNPSLPIVIYVHGYSQCIYTDTNQKISDVFHGAYNVIHVVWCRACADYFTSVCAVPDVGKQVAAFIEFLVANYDVSDVSVIGHSLGAHIAGFIGRNLATIRLNIIYGLDPASPLFSYDATAQRLTSNDANNVVVFHTNSGVFGMSQAIGNIDFYFNGGSCQADCNLLDPGSCSHSCSQAYLIAAIRGDNLPVKTCDNYQDALADKCGSNSYITVPDVLHSLGNITGTFYVSVNKANNYCKSGSFFSSNEYLCAGLQ